MLVPQNDLEKAVEACDVAKLEREIAKKKRKEQNFCISDHIRKGVIALMIRKGIRRTALLRSTRIQRMVQMLDFLASEGLEFSVGSLDKDGTLIRASTWNAALCRSLIRHGADVNAVDGDGKTALFYAVESVEARKVVGILLDSGIDFTVNLGDVLLKTKEETVLDLLIDRCISAESESQTGKIIMSIIGKFNDVKIFEVAEKMMVKIEYSIRQKIKINEYLGCLFLKGRIIVLNDTLMFWRKALQLGNERGIGGKGLPFYDNPGGLDVLQIDESWKFIYLYFLIIEGHHGDNRDENGTFILNGMRLICTDVWTEDNFSDIVHIVQFLLNNKCHELCDREPPLITKDFSSVRVSICEYIYSVTKLCNQLFGVAEQRKTESEKEEVAKLVAKFVKLNLADPLDRRALHWAAIRCSDPFIRLMLECGADVHARSSDGPLNPFQMYIWKNSSSLSCEMLDCFIEHGAHIDEISCGGSRIHEFLRKEGFSELQEGKHLTLKCLAARAVVDHGIPYQGEVPDTLDKFIQIHE